MRSSVHAHTHAHTCMCVCSLLSMHKHASKWTRTHVHRKGTRTHAYNHLHTYAHIHSLHQLPERQDSPPSSPHAPQRGAAFHIQITLTQVHRVHVGYTPEMHRCDLAYPWSHSEMHPLLPTRTVTPL